MRRGDVVDTTSANIVHALHHPLAMSLAPIFGRVDFRSFIFWNGFIACGQAVYHVWVLMFWPCIHETV